jgi:hypothetical protein
MNLKDIAVKILNEDTWGNNPAAAGNMSAGAEPTAVSPAPSPDVKFYSVVKDFVAFQTKVNAEEEAAKKELSQTLKKNLVNKEVAVRASKGSIGQEKDYTITVKDINISYVKDKYYIVLKADDRKDYYINSSFKMKILGAGKTETPPATILEPTDQGKNSPPLGGIVQPQNFGLGSSRNLS